MSNNMLDTFLGFDRLFTDTGISFPPYNIFKNKDGYLIELAIAGFKREDVNIEHDREYGTLHISGEMKKDISSDVQVVKQGIATRKFIRTFTVAENLKVIEAKLEDGMLTIILEKIKTSKQSPLKIELK